MFVQDAVIVDKEERGGSNNKRQIEAGEKRTRLSMNSNDSRAAMSGSLERGVSTRRRAPVALKDAGEGGGETRMRDKKKAYMIPRGKKNQGVGSDLQEYDFDDNSDEYVKAIDESNNSFQQEQMQMASAYFGGPAALISQDGTASSSAIQNVEQLHDAEADVNVAVIQGGFGGVGGVAAIEGGGVDLEGWEVTGEAKTRIVSAMKAGVDSILGHIKDLEELGVGAKEGAEELVAKNSEIQSLKDKLTEHVSDKEARIQAMSDQDAKIEDLKQKLELARLTRIAERRQDHLIHTVILRQTRLVHTTTVEANAFAHIANCKQTRLAHTAELEKADSTHKLEIERVQNALSVDGSAVEAAQLAYTQLQRVFGQSGRLNNMPGSGQGEGGVGNSGAS